MDRNPKQKVDDCAKILAYNKNEKVSLGQQVLATGIFDPGEVNHDMSQIIKRRMPMYEHEKKISGRASIGDFKRRSGFGLCGPEGCCNTHDRPFCR
jgi:hypothetical protein